jgi:hypothetical protein
MNLVLRVLRKPVRAAIRPVDAVERVVRGTDSAPTFLEVSGWRGR